MSTGKPSPVDLWSLLDASWTAEEGGLAAYLHRVLDNSAATFKASGASLFLLDSSTHAYRLTAQYGAVMLPEDAQIVPGIGIAGQAALRRQPMLISDPTKAPELQDVKRREDLASSMVIPLSTQESGCVGVLNLSRKSGLKPFSDEDLRKANTVARQLSLAISNALLFNRMDDAMKEARTVQIRLRTVLECLGVGMMILDRDGVVVQKNLQFPTLADAGCRWQDILDEMPPALVPEVTRAIEGAYRGAKEMAHSHDTVTDRTWAVIAFPMRVGVVVAIEETTEVTRLQRETARTNRLAEIGQMTAAIAHEIRNPLAGIIGAAQLLRDNPEDAVNLSAMIEEEATKLNELCSGFLAFARPISLNLDDVKLSDVARNVTDRQRPLFEEIGVKLNLDNVDDDSHVTADRHRLEQACLNLVLNALQACRPGDEVTVEARNGMLSVKDTGAGIDAATRERLFTPFFTTKPGGTGLGLSNVLKIVDAHGAQIEVESEPGVGAKFTLDFRYAA